MFQIQSKHGYKNMKAKTTFWNFTYQRDKYPDYPPSEQFPPSERNENKKLEHVRSPVTTSNINNANHLLRLNLC